MRTPGRDDRPAHGPARDDDAGADHRVERLPDAARLVEHELGGRQRLVPGEDRPLVVVEVEDRLDRDQVHVRVVVGVERPDVAPVAAVARRSRPGTSLAAKSQTLRLAALDQHRDDVAAESWFERLVVGVGRDRVDQQRRR